MRMFVSVLASVFFLGATAHAHDPGLSSAQLHFGQRGLEAVVTYHPLDLEPVAPLDLDFDGRVEEREFLEARPVLEALATDTVEIQTEHGPLQAAGATVNWERDKGQENVRFRLHFPLIGKPQRVAFTSLWVPQLSRGHRQFFAVHSAGGKVRFEALLDARHPAVEISLAAVEGDAAEAGSFAPFVALGLEHIVTGYDHLLFLFALLLAGGGLLAAAKIITSFTVAHSITLAMAAWGVVSLPAGLVEPLIAASIVIVAAENLFRRRLEGRWKLTFAFGLIHGLGFASVLRDMGVRSALPLLGFNLGVEAGQLALAAAALPAIRRLHQSPQWSSRLVPAGSCAVAFVGAWWLIERTALP